MYVNEVRWALLGLLVGVVVILVTYFLHPRPRRHLLGEEPGEVITIPLTAAPYSSNYDMYISVGFWNTTGQSQPLSLLCDSGNNVLIMPYFEQLDPAKYVVKGQTHEPWGCPCNIVEGQILIPIGNDLFWFATMLFLACTGSPDPAFVTAPRPRTPQITAGVGDGIRTFNFGLGTGTFAGLKAPLAYLPYLYTEILLNPNGPSSIVQTASNQPRPAGYSQDFSSPQSTFLKAVSSSQSAGQGFRIDTMATSWPDCGGLQPDNNAVLMDTGGGITYLSDPQGCLTATLAHQPKVECGSLGVACPGTVCYSLNGLQLQISSDGTTDNGSYTIDYPLGHTVGVIPTDCRYRVSEAPTPGLNVGGSTFAEAVDMMITYKTNSLAFRPKKKKLPGLYPADPVIPVPVLTSA